MMDRQDATIGKSKPLHDTSSMSMMICILISIHFSQPARVVRLCFGTGLASNCLGAQSIQGLMQMLLKPPLPPRDAEKTERGSREGRGMGQSSRQIGSVFYYYYYSPKWK